MEGVTIRFLDIIYNAYVYPINEVLDNVRLAVYTAWIVALALLVTKLLWRPLDEATTYGKLLHKKDSSRSAEGEQEPRHEGGSESRTSQQAASSNTARAEAESKSVGWLNQRLAFTSSYFIGLTLALCATVAVLVFAGAFNSFLHTPTPRSCPHLSSTDEHVVSESFDNTINNYPISIDGARVQLDKKEARFIDSPILEATGMVEPQLVDQVKEPTEKIYEQSLCSLVTLWNRKPKSLSSVLSENTLLETVMLCLSNVWAVHIGVTCSLLVIHLFRRLVECVLVHSFSPRSISLHNLLLMWAYYIFMPVAIIIDLVLEFVKASLNPNTAPLSISSIFSIGVGLELFLIASVLQYSSHKILASIRNQSTGASRYAYTVPKGGMFNFVSCPHYLAELLIYASFAIVSRGTIGSLLLLTFVSITMVSQGIKTHRWYLHIFSKEKLEGRKAIIPFLL
jgi:hypothetical protein